MPELHKYRTKHENETVTDSGPVAEEVQTTMDGYQKKERVYTFLDMQVDVAA